MVRSSSAAGVYGVLTASLRVAFEVWAASVIAALSDDVVYVEGYNWLGENGHSAFKDGVRFAEKYHGIGGGDE